LAQLIERHQKLVALEMAIGAEEQLSAIDGTNPPDPKPNNP
jgi:hypothetical protein